MVCLPAGWALTTSTDVPGVSAEDLRGYLELRAEREFPVPVADLRLAHCAFVLPDGNERATLAAVPAKRIEAIERMLATAECRAVSISLGLDACLPDGNRPQRCISWPMATTSMWSSPPGGGIAAVRTLPALGERGDDGIRCDGFSREVRITLGRLPEALRQQVREATFGGTPHSAENLCQEMRPHLTPHGHRQPAGTRGGRQIPRLTRCRRRRSHALSPAASPSRSNFSRRR